MRNLLLLLLLRSIISFGQTNNEMPISNINSHIEELDAIRNNRSLLEQYRFNKDTINQEARLRLNIALFNDFKKSDYDIAKFLFLEESKWRKTDGYFNTGEVDLLYFSALVVSQYEEPEMVIPFFETKIIDFDSGIGFDGEYLLSAGIEQTFKVLETSDFSSKDRLYKIIGTSVKECNYTADDISNWKKNKLHYFGVYILEAKK